MPLPPAHILVGAAAAEAVRPGGARPRWWVWVVGAAFGLLPDADIAYRLLLGEYAPLQRSATHSLLATAVVALVVWGAAGWRWATVAGAAYASHLLADLLQTQERTSVALFWPLHERGMEPIFHLFPYFPVLRGQGGRAAAEALFAPPYLGVLVEETLIALGIFLAVLALSTGVRRLRLGRAGRHPSA